MKNDALTAGVNLGGLRRKEDIKILICYLFSSIKISMSKEDVVKVLQENAIANYFEANSAFSELVTLQHLKADESDKNKFFATKSGELIAKELEISLPISMRDKSIYAALNLMAKVKRENENKVDIKKIKSGYNVILEISGGVTNLMSITMYTPDFNQAKLVKQNFHKNPDLFYECFLALATSNKKLIKEIFKNI
ncbi:MAG: DUF4364 family protein [Oscillospiraceae bacterium]|jgi:uncharacterized protein YktA (UPF0223 family)|nr:DUF4364 family protein [Oscillospiraceae bacterium]